MNAPILRTCTFAAVCGLLLAGVSAPARAEATYGYNDAGTGTVTATARVNLSVRVPKLILLRVGSTNTTVDTLTWTATASIPPVPTVPANGSSTAVNWDGTAPSFAFGTQPGALTVYAWTNAGTATINCALSAWLPGTGPGPTGADFSVTASGTLPHPGANLGACTSTAFPSNVVATGTWAYTLTGTPTAWAAGAHTATLTYTATGI
ncbi:MAG: hypothetical protein REJ24_03565 [Rhodocyclaceae bacterium]|nr:hypothetical protein [Pseudomonadota bacterium]MDQ7971616.1 hypothetical protein [Rhodocyclaceae bacterium]MDQ7999704.1 hypothetical protein [Pseudomonadota bacterium]MDQ8019068.1 hypothetical protein [Pseudomonadota bacterium]